jgi:hypothetical protein
VSIVSRWASIKVIGVWVFCLAALIVVHLGLVAPRGRAVTASQARVQAAVDRFTLLRNARSEREQTRLAAEQEEMDRSFAEYVFTAEQVNALDFELRNLADKNNLKEFSARHVRTTTKVGAVVLKKIAQRDIILSFKSTFPDLLRFINELERHSPIVIVDAFSPSAATDKSGLVSCTLEGCVLYEVAVPAGPAKPAQ